MNSNSCLRDRVLGLMNSRWKSSVTIAEQGDLNPKTASATLSLLFQMGAVERTKGNGRGFLYRSKMKQGESPAIQREAPQGGRLDRLLADTPLSEVALWLAEKVESLEAGEMK